MKKRTCVPINLFKDMIKPSGSLSRPEKIQLLFDAYMLIGDEKTLQSLESEIFLDVLEKTSKKRWLDVKKFINKVDKFEKKSKKSKLIISQ
jgi:hypothetical protein